MAGPIVELCETAGKKRLADIPATEVVRIQTTLQKMDSTAIAALLSEANLCRVLMPAQTTELHQQTLQQLKGKIQQLERKLADQAELIADQKKELANYLKEFRKQKRQTQRFRRKIEQGGTFAVLLEDFEVAQRETPILLRQLEEEKKAATNEAELANQKVAALKEKLTAWQTVLETNAENADLTSSIQTLQKKIQKVETLAQVAHERASNLEDQKIPLLSLHAKIQEEAREKLIAENKLKASLAQLSLVGLAKPLQLNAHLIITAAQGAQAGALSANDAMQKELYDIGAEISDIEAFLFQKGLISLL